MSTRTGRAVKPSAKLAFMEASSQDWDTHDKYLDSTKVERKQKRKESDKAKKAAKDAKKSPAKKSSKGAKGGAKTGPKKPKSPYLCFAKETRAEVVQEYPNATFTDVAKILGEWWGDLGATGKKKFEKMAAKDKERYQAEMAGTGSKTATTSTSSKAKKATPKAKKVAPTPTGKVSYEAMAKAAILALKDRKGSSQMAIERYISETYTELNFQKHHVLKALKVGTTKGTFTRVKNSFKVAKK